jgi:hypothetical protein
VNRSTAAGRAGTAALRIMLDNFRKESSRTFAQLMALSSQQHAAEYYALAGDPRFNEAHRRFAQREAAMWSATARIWMDLE